MPLVRLELRNEYGLGDRSLHREAATREDPKAVLDGVMVGGLVGILRQLGDLAGFAADIFYDLDELVAVTSARAHKVLSRIEHIEAALPAVEKAIECQTSHIHFAYLPGSDWHAEIQIKNDNLINSELPQFITNSYEECRYPPRLFLLDKFDVSGPGSCLKRYSDPSFFRRIWSSSQISETEKVVKRRKAQNRHKVEELRMRNREMQHVYALSCLSSSMHTSSPSFDGQSGTSISTSNERLKIEVESYSTSFSSRTRIYSAEPIAAAASDHVESVDSKISGSNLKIQDGYDSASSSNEYFGGAHDLSLVSLQLGYRSRSPSIGWDEKTEIHMPLCPITDDVNITGKTDTHSVQFENGEHTNLEVFPVEVSSEHIGNQQPKEEMTVNLSSLLQPCGTTKHPASEAFNDTNDCLNALNFTESETVTDLPLDSEQKITKSPTCDVENVKGSMSDSSSNSYDVMPTHHCEHTQDFPHGLPVEEVACAQSLCGVDGASGVLLEIVTDLQLESEQKITISPSYDVEEIEGSISCSSSNSYDVIMVHHCGEHSQDLSQGLPVEEVACAQSLYSVDCASGVEVEMVTDPQLESEQKITISPTFDVEKMEGSASDSSSGSYEGIMAHRCEHTQDFSQGLSVEEVTCAQSLYSVDCDSGVELETETDPQLESEQERTCDAEKMKGGANSSSNSYDLIMTHRYGEHTQDFPKGLHVEDLAGAQSLYNVDFASGVNFSMDHNVDASYEHKINEKSDNSTSMYDSLELHSLKYANMVGITEMDGVNNELDRNEDTEEDNHVNSLDLIRHEADETSYRNENSEKDDHVDSLNPIGYEAEIRSQYQNEEDRTASSTCNILIQDTVNDQNVQASISESNNSGSSKEIEFHRCPEYALEFSQGLPSYVRIQSDLLHNTDFASGHDLNLQKTSYMTHDIYEHGTSENENIDYSKLATIYEEDRMTSSTCNILTQDAVNDQNMHASISESNSIGSPKEIESHHCTEHPLESSQGLPSCSRVHLDLLRNTDFASGHDLTLQKTSYVTHDMYEHGTSENENFDYSKLASICGSPKLYATQHYESMFDTHKTDVQTMWQDENCDTGENSGTLNFVQLEVVSEAQTQTKPDMIESTCSFVFQNTTRDLQKLQASVSKSSVDTSDHGVQFLNNSEYSSEFSEMEDGSYWQSVHGIDATPDDILAISDSSPGNHERCQNQTSEKVDSGDLVYSSEIFELPATLEDEDMLDISRTSELLDTSFQREDNDGWHIMDFSPCEDFSICSDSHQSCSISQHNSSDMLDDGKNAFTCSNPYLPTVLETESYANTKVGCKPEETSRVFVPNEENGIQSSTYHLPSVPDVENYDETKVSCKPEEINEENGIQTSTCEVFNMEGELEDHANEFPQKPEASDKSSVCIWTNGGLFGVEPSKPQDINLRSVGPDAASPISANKCDPNGIKFPVELQNNVSCSIPEQQTSDNPESHACILYHNQNNLTNGGLLNKFLAESIDTKPYGRKPDANIIPYFPGDLLANLAWSLQRNVSLESKRPLETTGRPLLPSGTIGTDSLVCQERTFSKGHKNISGGIASNGHHSTLGDDKCVVNSSKDLSSSGSLPQCSSSPPSPPLQTMKISFQPLNGTNTSRLKLEFPGRSRCDSIEELMFPSFQLLQGPESFQPINSESDDDTFCRSSEYDSENGINNNSESDSEIWDTNELAKCENGFVCDTASDHDSAGLVEMGQPNAQFNYGYTLKKAPVNVESYFQPGHLDIPCLDFLRLSVSKEECKHEPSPGRTS